MFSARRVTTLARVSSLPGRSLQRNGILATCVSTRGLASRRPKPSSSFEPPYRNHREPSNLRIGVTLVLFGALGLAAYYGTQALRVWPPEVRKDLRSALLAKQKGDLKSSAIHFQNAYTTAVSLPDPIASFGIDHVLLISSIAVALADVLESVNLADAYSVYETAFADLRLGNFTQDPSGDRARIRAIGISLKLGDIGERLLKQRSLTGKTPTHGPENINEVEGHWNWAVEESLRYKTTNLISPEVGGIWDGLIVPLPRWTEQPLDVAAVFEDAGSFYRRLGKNEYAVPLYLQAVSTMYPQGTNGQSSKKKPPIADRCKAAMVMNNLGSMFASSAPLDLAQAEKWSRKALEISETAARDAPLNLENHCLATYTAVLYNLGSISEMKQNKNQAIAYYNHCLDIAISAHYVDGADQARQALKRLGQIRTK